MHPLTASELLQVWEQGQNWRPFERALLLLAAACPESPPEALTRLSIGQRDARLLTLREWTFGPQLVSLAACPKCGALLDLNFSVDEIRVNPSDSFSSSPAPLPPEGPGDLGQGEGLALELSGYHVRFRLPDSQDLEAIAARAPSVGDVQQARNLLFERCLLAVRRNGRPAEASSSEPSPDSLPSSPSELPPQVVEAVLERMAQADPQADVNLSLECPACNHQWQAAFDILAFFWKEIEAWAGRILSEVHILASAYGWDEADILALSSLRRQAYLELIGA
jgi:hypothetical protein